MRSTLLSIHKLMLQSPVTRKVHRKILGKIKEGFGVPDPYVDLVRIMNTVASPTVLDVGSFVGVTIQRFMDLYGQPVAIHGFEPTSESYTKLAMRFHGHAAVKIHNLALSNTNGTAVLFKNSFAQMNSLLQNAEGNEEAFPELSKPTGEQSVQTRRLDDWATSNIPSGPLIVKCDIQGAEGKFVEGGAATLSDRVVAILSEAQLRNMYKGQTDFFELHARLLELGFELFNIYPCLTDTRGQSLQTDCLWVKPDVWNG